MTCLFFSHEQNFKCTWKARLALKMYHNIGQWIINSKTKNNITRSIYIYIAIFYDRPSTVRYSHQIHKVVLKNNLIIIIILYTEFYHYTITCKYMNGNQNWQQNNFTSVRQFVLWLLLFSFILELIIFNYEPSLSRTGYTCCRYQQLLNLHAFLFVAPDL